MKSTEKKAHFLKSGQDMFSYERIQTNRTINSLL